MTGELDQSQSSDEVRLRQNQNQNQDQNQQQAQQSNEDDIIVSESKEQRRCSQGSARSLRSKDDRTATELPDFPLDTHISDGEERPRYSEATTAEDSERTRRRFSLVRQTPNWYDGLPRVWHREVSVKVDAGHRRDHLGKSFA